MQRTTTLQIYTQHIILLRYKDVGGPIEMYKFFSEVGIFTGGAEVPRDVIVMEYV